MYLDFFGMKQLPFQIIPDASCLYLSQQHARAMVYMDYATWNAGGFVVITGEIGSGKTTLVKWVLNKFAKKSECFHVEFTNLTGNDLFHYLLKQVGVNPNNDDKISLIYAFQDYLRKCTRSGKPCLLIIDEAQNLTKNQLEDIRMLAALEGPDGPMLRITLLGQPELIQTIQDSEQFKQRINLHYHLKGLDLKDMDKYIEFRMKKSGYSGDGLFTDVFIPDIYKYSKGIPRLINKICDGLLMCAFADDRYTLKAEDFDSILADLMIKDGHALHQLQDAPNVQGKVKDYSTLLERLAIAIEDLNKNLSILAEKK